MTVKILMLISTAFGQFPGCQIVIIFFLRIVD